MTQPNKQKESWWATLPGIITGIAALITAIVGLLTILQQTGFFVPNVPKAGTEIPKGIIGTPKDTIKGPQETTKSTNDTIITKDKDKQSDPAPPINLLVGTWKNEWTINGATSSETVIITEDGRYYANGVYSFLIHNVAYDKSTNQIRFIKTSVVDPRDLLNTLTVENNNVLVGSESYYSVRYTKLPN